MDAVLLQTFFTALAMIINMDGSDKVVLTEEDQDLSSVSQPEPKKKRVVKNDTKSTTGGKGRTRNAANKSNWVSEWVWFIIVSFAN